MESLLNTLDVSQVSFACLFVWLLLDTNKKNEARELKYQQTIDKLADNINIINDVKDDVEEIKVILRGE